MSAAGAAAGPDADPVDDLRQKGNHEFQQGNLDAAISLYSAGLELLVKFPSIEKNIVLLCNRSACYMRLMQYEAALEDAKEAFALSQSQNVKAAYRLAKTYLALEEAKNALQVLEALQSNNADLTEEEQKSVISLKHQAQQQQRASEQQPPETTVKTVSRPLSIREFERPQTNALGVGNFSEIVICKHKATNEKFALKILDKKTAADLAKRQHPNVHNEIAMEARVLLQRLPPHPNMIQMYHSFQDYTCIYYLMECHDVNPDLWTRLRHKGCMVGTHASQVQIWASELVDALEHFHKHGIVHRDLKPENILLNRQNHVVVIDFGTAKDLIQTDLNGPEFVGTPDFMSPEAVTGISSTKPSAELLAKHEGKAATHATDLWAFGGTLYIMLTGSTPFWSPSPYLTFLRIQRGILPRLGGIWNDEAWDLITKLMQVQPSRRLGASVPWMTKDGDNNKSKSYQCLRDHAYFASLPKLAKQRHVIPSLQDLCIRAAADLIQKDAVDLDLCDAHPPGDGSAHDVTRLTQQQRFAILHVLEKSKVFKGGDETRVFQRFHSLPVAALKAKVLRDRREFLGLTRMIDEEYKIPSHRGSEDPYATKDKLLGPTTKVAVLSNPLLLSTTNKIEEKDEKVYIQQWKQCIGAINKQRPKAVIVCGQNITKKCWKFLARIRDSIPVIWNDGSVHYTFWLNGFQGIILQSSHCGVDSRQMLWLSELMEQSRMAKHKVFCFCDCDPRDLPPLVIKKLARGKVVALIGLKKEQQGEGGGKGHEGETLDSYVTYEPNETVPNSNDVNEADNVSVKSNDSVEDDMDRSTMRVMGTSQNSLRWLTIDEKEEWTMTLDIMVGVASKE